MTDNIAGKDWNRTVNPRYPGTEARALNLCGSESLLVKSLCAVPRPGHSGKVTFRGGERE